MFAEVARRGFADLDPVAPCIAALESDILLVEGAALGRGAFDMHQGIVRFEMGRPFYNLAGAWSLAVLELAVLVELDGE